MKNTMWKGQQDRRFFIGGSDARIIMGNAMKTPWGGVRGQVHAALVLLGGGGCRKYIPHCSTTCVGGGGPAGSALGDQRGRGVGRDKRQCRPALPASDCDRRAQVLRCVETGDFIAVAVAWNASSTCRAVVKVFLVPRAR